MSISKALATNIDSKVNKIVESAKRQGIDFDKYNEQEIKYILELNKPKGPRVISADSPEGRGITEALLGRKEGKVIEGKFGKPFAKEVESMQDIADARLIDDMYRTAGPRNLDEDAGYLAEFIAEDAGKIFDDLPAEQQRAFRLRARKALRKNVEKYKKFPTAKDPDFEDVGPFDNDAEKLAEIKMSNEGFIDDIITDIKQMEPMDSMKEANKVLKGEGRYKNLSQADREKIVNDESVTDHIFERDVPIDPEDMATGGRVGLKTGMSKRAFLKLMGGAAAGIGALKTGALKMFGKETAKNIPQVVTTPPVAGKPAWFDSVVNKVIAEGDDVTKQFAYKDRMQVNTKQISPTEEVTVYRDLDDGSVRINYGAKMRIDETKPYEKGNIGRASNDPDQVDLIVREGEVIEPVIEGKYKGTVGRKTQSSFEASEAEPRSVGGPEDADIEFDGERIVNNVDDLMEDVSPLEEYATGKKLTGDKAAKAQKKREAYERFTQDQMEQAEYLETKYGPGPEPDDFASGGLAGMLGE